ncbi:MAG: phosphate acyltransferase [Alphaproteobacteria bacterium]|nr:phosphate acyltransferase [Alphaproteobacteria bacterium]
MKKLIVIGHESNYIKLSDVESFGFTSVMDVSPDEFAAMDIDVINTVIVKGVVETSEMMRVILLLNKKLGGEFLSHCAIFNKDGERPFIITDAALNISPDLTEKYNITLNAVRLSREFGLSGSPVVNFITPSSKVSDKIKSSVDAATLQKWLKEGEPNIKTYHNAFDVCFSKDAQEIKGITMPRPDILISDDIDQGNSLWKALTIFGGFSAAGFVVGNERLPPVVLNSRSDSFKDKIGAIATAGFGVKCLK